MPLSSQAQHRKDQIASPPTLQHRHFAFIAQTLWTAQYDPRGQDVANIFADALAKTNPNFDRARFLRAAGQEN